MYTNNVGLILGTPEWKSTQRAYPYVPVILVYGTLYIQYTHATTSLHYFGKGFSEKNFPQSFVWEIGVGLFLVLALLVFFSYFEVGGS